MKITCSSCKELKDIEEFAKTNRNSHFGVGYCCRKCVRIKSKKSHLKHKVKRNAKLYAYKAEIKAIIAEAKCKPCADCGVQYEYYIMEFDHLDFKTKEFDLGVANGSLKSKQKVLDEIDKCEVVCSNCHRIRTYERRYRT